MMDVSDTSVLQQFGEVRRRINLVLSAELREVGLGTKQMMFVRLLDREGKLSPGLLARRTLTDPAAAGRVVDSLVKAGLVERRRSRVDRRRADVALTDAGRALVPELERAYGRAAERFGSALTREERGELARLLDKIGGALPPLPGEEG